MSSNKFASQAKSSQAKSSQVKSSYVFVFQSGLVWSGLAWSDVCHLLFLLLRLFNRLSPTHGVPRQKVEHSDDSTDGAEHDLLHHLPEIVDRGHPRVELLQEPAVHAGADPEVPCLY